MRETVKISVLFIQGMFVGPSMRVAPTLSIEQVVLDCRDTRQRCIFRKVVGNYSPCLFFSIVSDAFVVDICGQKNLGTWPGCDG
jgi:hypothetical protein